MNYKRAALHTSAIGCSLLLCLTSALASTFLLVEVEPQALNVRQAPKAKSAVVSTLKQGERLYARSAAPGWLLVVTQDGTVGYVAANYVRVLQVFTSTEEEDCDPDVSIRILSSDFRCREKLLGDGFDSCTVDFFVDLSANCEKELYVAVECRAQFQYETENGIFPKTSSQSSYGSTHVRDGYGSTSLSVTWRPMTILDPVIRVQLQNASCEVTRVRE